MGITILVSLYTSRIILNTLGVSDYGLYNVIGGIIGLVSFLNGSLAQGTQRFMNFYLGQGDYDVLNKIFSTSLIFQILLSILVLIIGETIGIWFVENHLNIENNRITAAKWVFQFSTFAVIISILQVPYNALIIANEKMDVFAYISILDAILKLIVVHILRTIDFDKLKLYSIFIVIASFITTCIYIFYCKFTYHKESNFVFNKEKKIYHSLLTFSGWNIFGTTTNIMSVQGVNILLNIFFGSIVNAARGIAIQISTLFDNLINNIQVAMNPQIIKLYSMKRYRELNTFLINNFKINFFLYWFFFLPVFLELDFILQLWLIDIPEYTLLFCRIIMIRTLIKCFERPLITGMFAVGRMKYPNIISGCFLLVAVLVSYVLFKQGYSPYIPFVFDIFAIIGCCIWDMYFLRKHIDYSIKKFLNQVLFPVSIIILVSSIITSSLFFCISDSLVRLISVTFVSMFISALLIYFIGISKDMRYIVNRRMKLFLRKVQIHE